MEFIKAKSFFKALVNPMFLYKKLWKAGTTALLHAPRAVDKTSTAIQIANDVALSGREVLYINCNDLGSQITADADNLYVFTPEFESIDDNRDYADIVFEGIEEAVRETGIRTFVIDSITRIAALSFGRNASAAYIMKRLVALQVKCKLSILVLADDTTKSANNALLALAASEITISENSGISELPEPSFPTTMTRQQRRALERQRLKKSPMPTAATFRKKRAPTRFGGTTLLKSNEKSDYFLKKRL